MQLYFNAHSEILKKGRYSLNYLPPPTVFFLFTTSIYFHNYNLMSCAIIFVCRHTCIPISLCITYHCFNNNNNNSNLYIFIYALFSNQFPTISQQTMR